MVIFITNYGFLGHYKLCTGQYFNGNKLIISPFKLNLWEGLEIINNNFDHMETFIVKMSSPWHMQAARIASNQINQWQKFIRSNHETVLEVQINIYN